MFFTVRNPFCEDIHRASHLPMRLLIEKQFGLAQANSTVKLPTNVFSTLNLPNDFSDAKENKDSETSWCCKKDHFEVKLNVNEFNSDELNVKAAGNYVVIEGKHEEKQDNDGYVSRQFTRRFTLPEGIKSEEVTCSLNSEGMLVISAPRMIEKPKTGAEVLIPIRSTGHNHYSNISKKENITEKANDKPGHHITTVTVSVNKPTAA